MDIRDATPKRFPAIKFHWYRGLPIYLIDSVSDFPRFPAHEPKVSARGTRSDEGKRGWKGCHVRIEPKGNPTGTYNDTKENELISRSTVVESTRIVSDKRSS